MRDLRIVFMGTPDFAVGTLAALLKANINVVGVITAPDKPAGRGRKINESAVKKFAVANNLKVLQPTNLKDEAFIAELESLNANLQIVVAFRMLPKVVWQMPEYGTFNLHASLLPDYRGAAPINWAIINGETKTGVSTFFIDEKIDTGNVILQEEVSIGEHDTLGELHDTLMRVGSDLVVKTVVLIKEDKVTTFKQPEIEEKSAPKIFNETCKINWNDTLTNIYNLIRGLNPYPAAWTTLNDNNTKIKVKIYDVKKEFQEHQLKPGTISTTKTDIKVAVKNGYLIIDSLQLSGKRKMDSKSLLNGFAFSEQAYFQ
ncbi:methionyl-tRNA formyltransferase [Lutibacter agarilyticus]|uniref:Methionyl-tRNA formyltransferase n=1 Tax=Lutibacter agarilyticus TaxID=1109740 RepID=A0A238WWT6_9FLAO|nr:methionyl-tRNA formyltransferase [Lutibacter agarilyticus]SNR50811.1 methionyl-tRNA formyltransferase [Lutibacter agarilyticus]